MIPYGGGYDSHPGSPYDESHAGRALTRVRAIRTAVSFNLRSNFASRVLVTGKFLVDQHAGRGLLLLRNPGDFQHPGYPILLNPAFIVKQTT